MAEANPAAAGTEAAIAPASSLWSRHRSLLWPAAPLLVILLLASFTWPTCIWPTRISGRLVASTVSLTLGQGATVQCDLALRPPRAGITGAAVLDLPPGLGGATIRRQGLLAAKLSTDNGSLFLSSLTLGADLDLTLQRGLHRGLMLFVRGDSTIEFEAGGSVVVSSDGAEPESAHLVPPEIIAVQTDSGSAVPIGIQTDTSEPLVIENLLVSRLAFTRALSAGGRGSPFVSSVVSGNVQLVDIARSETLEPGSALVLENFEGWVVHLESTPDGFAVSFTGTARRVELGPLGHLDDLTPSILDYLFHQQLINMLWVSALAGIAMIAKVRAWAVGRLED